MKRDFVIVGALWLIITAIGEALILSVELYPAAQSDKGEEIESAFRILLIFAVPVFALVVAVLLYSVLRHSMGDEPPEDGPAFHGRGLVPFTWLGVTTALTALIIIYPGLTSLSAVIGDDSNPDLVVEVTGFQWQWQFTYPQQGITIIGTPDDIPEMVLPVDRSVRFDITSVDVLHSFWVPAFLMKIDAVPGMTTTISLRPTKTGTFLTDSMLRVQCAELCGLKHSTMAAHVAVVTEQEFEEWLADQQALSAGAEQPTPVTDAQEFTIIGEDILFDVDEIQVEASGQVVVTFDNRDTGVPHNWAVYESEEAATSGGAPIAGSPIESGPLTQTIVFDAPEPGTYFYRCDVHPTTMTGALEVR